MRELICSTFSAAWPAASGGVPFALENEAFPTSDTFVLLTIQPTVSQQTTMGPRGTRRIERKGWIQAKLWGPVNTGSAGLAALGDVVQSILELKSLPSPVPNDEPVTTFAANAGPGGASTDGRFYMGICRIPFCWVERV